MSGFALVIAMAWLGLFAACGSRDKRLEPRSFKPPYRVLNAKRGLSPQWSDAPEQWAREHDREADQYRYFTYETEPKNSRSVACKLAQANAVASIAGEMTQFIKQSLGASEQGEASSQGGRLEAYVETTLAREVQGFVVGASVYRTYWEHRSYQKSLGADRNRQGYMCAALVRIKRSQLERAMVRAQKKLEALASPEAKQNVKQALKEAARNFSQPSSEQ